MIKVKPSPIAALLVLAIPGMLRAAESVTLVENRKAKMAITIREDDFVSLEETTLELQSMLKRISGANFAVTKGMTTEPSIRLQLKRTKPGLRDRENYRIFTSREDGLLIEGSTPRAVQHGTWDLMYRIGYRQFFPGEAWEIIPDMPTISLALDRSESPDYINRRIWYGFGFWDHNRETWGDWVRKNRMGEGFTLHTGHAYGRLIRSQQSIFDAHPEYYALVGGERHIHPQAKLCIGNPGTRDAAIAYAVEYLENNPEEESVSIDPSDGGNWCECESCREIGPPNERALFLANTIARAVTAKFGKNKLVGMYAYNQHSPPPAGTVHPNVVISAATGFIKGGMKVEEIIRGWFEKGAQIGIREYYSVNTWDRDLPGRARGSNLAYLEDTIPRFHGMGARFLTAEASDNWGCNGLGYYFASRVMWDIGEAKRRHEIVEDFLEKAFGPAADPMRDFYELIEGSNKKAQLVFEDLLGRMFRHLEEARQLAAGNAPVIRRIDQLILYTRHAELYEDYRSSTGEKRQASYEAMIRHSYRIRRTHMVHSLALWRDVVRRDKTVSYPDEMHWPVPEGKNPWKSSEPFYEKEVTAILRNGIERHNPIELDFEPRKFSDEDLAPALTLYPDLQVKTPGKAETGRAGRSWFTVVDKAPATIELRITGGLIAAYRDRGNVKVQLWKLGGDSETGERKSLVAEDASVPPDGKERVVKLQAKQAGTYRIDLNDGHDLTRVTWPDGQAMSWKMSLDDHPHTMSGRWYLYFYVPEGTRKIGLYTAAGTGSRLLNPKGELAGDLESKSGRFLSVDVPEGMDGKLWKFHHMAGRADLLNVPPFLARTPGELVLPR